MGRLEGVIDVGWQTSESLKRLALIFDHLHVIENTFTDDSGLDPDLTYLAGRGLVSRFTDKAGNLVEQSVPLAEKADLKLNPTAYREYGKKATFFSIRDWQARICSAAIGAELREVEVVPICLKPPTGKLGVESAGKREVLEIALYNMPLPGPMSSWEDVVNFREEMHDKSWNFRRFLHSLSTKKQTESEIRDDIEWSLSEYTKSMNIHELKGGNSFIEVYVIPVIELAEDLAKFNWSKIAKGALSVKKRQVELMEAEMKAPGRECAYVFEAQKRFGKLVE